jgi:ADP-heptose:LPS heptosyltransferase
LGDCVLTTPAIALLKAARPDLSIGIVVEDRFAAIFEDNPDISAILPPSFPAVAGWRPQLCINVHGGVRSALLTVASLARCRAGFQHFRWPAVYNFRIPRAQQILHLERKVHTAEHLASAMFHLGVPETPIPRAKLVATNAPVVAQPYAVIHPFAALPEKTWPASRFLDVARQIERSENLEPVFLAGPGEDPSGFSRHRVVAAPPLSEVKRLMAGASLFIGNDSGPAHIAAAFGVPVVVLFGTSDPVIWRPWRTDCEVLTSNGNIAAIATGDVVRAVVGLRVAK